jgi:hypothetical protein
MTLLRMTARSAVATATHAGFTRLCEHGHICGLRGNLLMYCRITGVIMITGYRGTRLILRWSGKMQSLSEPKMMQDRDDITQKDGAKRRCDRNSRWFYPSLRVWPYLWLAKQSTYSRFITCVIIFLRCDEKDLSGSRVILRESGREYSLSELNMARDRDDITQNDGAKRRFDCKSSRVYPSLRAGPYLWLARQSPDVLSYNKCYNDNGVIEGQG